MTMSTKKRKAELLNRILVWADSKMKEKNMEPQRFPINQNVQQLQIFRKFSLILKLDRGDQFVDKICFNPTVSSQHKPEIRWVDG